VLVVFHIVLHANKLSHTDLKPENILFVNSEFEVIDVIRPGKSKKVTIMLELFILYYYFEPQFNGHSCSSNYHTIRYDTCVFNVQ